MDPFKTLPLEALVLLFSLLSTREIAICTSVSKRWRNLIQVDAVINRVIDLVEFRDQLTEEEIIDLIIKLAQLSSHPQREIHLHLQPFWKSMLSWFHDLKVLTAPRAIRGARKYTTLISALSLATQNQLKKVYFVIEENYFSFSQRKKLVSQIVSQIIIEGALDLFQVCPNLKELHLRLPFPFSLTSGDFDSKICSISQTNRHAQIMFCVPSTCLALIRDITDSTGYGLTTLSLSTKVFQTPQTEPFPLGDPDLLSEVAHVLSTIELSRLTLKELNLRIGLDLVLLQQAFSLVTNCPNLSFLLLELFWPNPIGQAWFQEPILDDVHEGYLSSLKHLDPFLGRRQFALGI